MSRGKRSAQGSQQKLRSLAFVAVSPARFALGSLATFLGYASNQLNYRRTLR